VSTSIFAFDTLSRPQRREWLAIACVAAITLLFLPVVMWKTVALGQGDVRVFFRAAWAVWTGYPLYEVADNHGWTYHYPPTFALLLGLFADPLPGHPRPWWALPFPAAVAVWYLINVLCLLLSLHVWANALERWRPVQAPTGFLQWPWLIRFGPFLALLPFLGDGLARGQPNPVLLLLMVSFLALYQEGRIASAAFAFALAVSVKLFPAVLVVVPFFRRDFKFIIWAAGWCALFLVGLPVICLGPVATLDLYRTLFSEHLAGIVSGSMSPERASEVSPGAYSSVGFGAMVGRIAAGGAFYTSELPGWVSTLQLLFNTGVIAAVVVLGRGGFWNLRGTQPASGYAMLLAGAVLSAAIPLMIPFAKNNYVTFAVPLMGAFMIEAWRRTGRVVTGTMIAWVVLAWTSMLALEVPWTWLKTIGPTTWALLLLGPASFALLAKASQVSEHRQ
jgi:glycosyl transferase family 87